MKTSTAYNYSQRVMRVQSFIQNNLDTQLLLEELAEVAMMSPYHFHRVFRDMVGEPIKVYIRRLRLEKAAMQLRFTNISLKRIAVDAQYNTTEAFNRAFKNRFDVTPAAYREQYRNIVANHRNDFVTSDDPYQKFREMEVEITHVEQMTVAYIRQDGPFKALAHHFETLHEWLSSQDLDTSNRRHIGLIGGYPPISDNEYVFCDACIEVDSNIKGHEIIGVRTILKGKYAVVELENATESRRSELFGWLLEEWLSIQQLELDMRPWLVEYASNNPSEQAIKVFMPIRGA